jgi:hypothetical protein
MSALLAHAQAARIMAKAFGDHARAVDKADPVTARILARTALAYDDGAEAIYQAMRDEARANLKDETE